MWAKIIFGLIYYSDVGNTALEGLKIYLETDRRGGLMRKNNELNHISGEMKNPHTIYFKDCSI